MPSIKIHTYFEPPGHKIYKLFKLSWEKHGWEVITHRREEAAGHPIYGEYMTRTDKYPTVNSRTYEDACYRRWLTYDLIGEPFFFADYDMINFGLIPYTPEKEFISGPGIGFGYITPNTCNKFIMDILQAEINPAHMSDMICIMRTNNLTTVNPRHIIPNNHDVELIHFGGRLKHQLLGLLPALQ